MGSNSVHPCDGCVYMGIVSGQMPCCNYIFMEDRKRPCPPGDRCTVKKTGKYKKAVHKRMAIAEERRRKRKEAEMAARVARIRTVQCGVCGAVFETDIHNKRYCSKDCSRIAHNKNWLAYHNRKMEREKNGS